MTAESDPAQPCARRIDAGGLRHRGAAILERERGVYPLATNQLSGRRSKGEAAGIERAFTVDDLERAVGGGDVIASAAAAFLAGRCEPATESDRPRLNALLHKILETMPIDDVGTTAAAYIEASMSLALRGEVNAARGALSPVATDLRPETTMSWLAAYYLAQVGDPSGWAAIVHALVDGDEHNRLMAARQLIAFVPYRGERVAGDVIDVRSRLVETLRDSSPWVSGEAPGLLAEAKVEGLAELLQDAAQHGRRSEVRHAAATVLHQLRDE